MAEPVFAAEPSRLLIAAAAGSVPGFLRTSRRFGKPGKQTDEKTTLQSWSMMETIIGITGLLCAIVISLFA